jgi:alpha-tubulin suppressor-like RCC1 family protein
VGGYKFRQVSGGESHTCGVTTSARAFCWGYGRYGQIGDGKTVSRFRPTPVAGGHSFSHVSGGERHTCGVNTEKRAYCWGENLGALGDGTSIQRLTPSAVSGGLRFRQVESGAGHTCGVTPENRAYCWGNDYHGQRGDGAAETITLAPVPVRGPN